MIARWERRYRLDDSSAVQVIELALREVVYPPGPGTTGSGLR